MAVSLAAKIILVTAICFTVILITLIATIVMVTNSQNERYQNQSMSLHLIYWLILEYFEVYSLKNCIFRKKWE